MNRALLAAVAAAGLATPAFSGARDKAFFDRIAGQWKGPGEIVATDNGDPTSVVPFQSPEREAFNGLTLAIVRGKAGQAGKITVRAEAAGLEGASMAINTTRR